MPSKKPHVTSTDSKELSLSRRDVIQTLARKTGVTKRTATTIVDALEELVVSELKAGRSVTLTGFGTFYSAERPARRGINPNTLKAINIPAMQLPHFRPGARLKLAIREGSEGKSKQPRPVKSDSD